MIPLQIELESPGSRIRHARQNKELTMHELSLITGVSSTSVGYIERGVVQPSLSSLRKLSAILEKPISYLGCFEKMPEDTLGQRLRKARYFHGLQAIEAANELGVDVKTIFNWESDRNIPSINIVDLDQFLEVLNTY